MDPNVALVAIRSMLNAHKNGQRFDVDDFAEIVNGLDEWLTKGGFLPQAWQNNGR
jgi:hypothetical protein